jgi:hypothetical protein
MPTKKEQKAANDALAAAAAPGPIANCVWSNNNLACANTWFCLGEDILGQLGKKESADFDIAGEVTMPDLTFWNKTASAASRQAEAEELAGMLTKLFCNMIGAQYESGHNFASAVEAMTAILTDANKTVCELAAVVDEQHHFSGEPV